MKKIFALMLALVMILSVIPFAAAADHEHVDANGNEMCDVEGCTEKVHSKHYDDNSNGVCDYPGCTAKVETAHTHVDANGNGVCDFAGCTYKMPTGEDMGPGLDDDDDDVPGFPGNNNGTHEHTFYGSYKHNATYHWRQCWCGYVKASSKVKHNFNSRGECRTCGYDKGYGWDDDRYDGDYRVYLTESGRGDTELSTRYADSRDTVYIYADPDNGYKVRDIEVTTRYGKDVQLTKRSNYVYYFRMPSSDVYVEVTYTGSSYSSAFQPSRYYDDDCCYGNYSDVASGDWFYSAVNYVTDREIMEGYTYGKFAPNANMTRAMLAEALYAISNANATGSEKFSDVDRYDDFYEAVVWCSNKGIIEGWNGKFVPNGDITREDLAVMLYRYAEYKRYNTKASEDLDQFSDADDVSAYAVEALEWAVAEGIITGMGNGTLAPQGTTTRAQAATMIMRFCKGVN